MQTDLFSPSDSLNPKLPNDIEYFSKFLGQSEADVLLHYLRSSLDWQQPELRIFGKWHKIPRLQTWMGDCDTSYSYSGKVFTPVAWDKTILNLKTMVEHHCGYKFNSVLLNYYRTGQDKMGWHADDEPELGSRPAIACVSLGAERSLLFKHNISRKQYYLDMVHGSLLIMKPGVQNQFKHALPARKRINQSRISLTFRYIYS